MHLSLFRFRFRSLLRIALLSSFCLFTACATINYDQQADQQITALTQQINLQYLSWESQARSNGPVAYDAKFYDTVEASLATLEMRMTASQDASSAKLTQLFQNLMQQLENERKFHQEHALDAAYCHAERLLINTQLAVLTTYELSLKNSAGSKAK